jgi:hypothetical protein
MKARSCGTFAQGRRWRDTVCLTWGARVAARAEPAFRAITCAPDTVAKREYLRAPTERAVDVEADN